jgi:hypothetical protein
LYARHALPQSQVYEANLEADAAVTCGEAMSEDQELTPHDKALLEAHKLGLMISAMQARVTDTLICGLQADGAHHKQWALWRIAEIMGVTHFLSDIEDKGIKP